LKSFIFILLFIPFCVYSQKSVKHSISGDFKLPSALSNRAFKSTSDGVADLSIVYQNPFIKGFGLGAGFSFLYLKINEFAFSFPGRQIEGEVKRYAPFGKIFYQRKINSQFLLDFGTKIGYSFFDYSSSFCTEMNIDSKDQGLFIEPSIGLHMFAQENFSIGLVLAYGVNSVQFSPSSLCLSSFPGYDQSDYDGNSNVLSIGFSFSAFLKQKGR